MQPMHIIVPWYGAKPILKYMILNRELISRKDCSYSEPRRKRKRKDYQERIDWLESRLEAMESSITPANAASQPAASDGTYYNEIRAPDSPLQVRSSGQTVPSEIEKSSPVYHTVDHEEVEFQGQSGERAFMELLKKEIWDSQTGDMTSRRLPLGVSVPGLFELGRQTDEVDPLPERCFADKLVQAAFDAQILLNIIHRPTFEASLNFIYSVDLQDHGAEEKRFLSLLYAVLAYGCLFVDARPEEAGHEKVVSSGYFHAQFHLFTPLYSLSDSAKFYAKSRQLQNIADSKDITSLQAIVFMNLFLLSSTRISTCYTYLSSCLSIALRMGLHRTLKANQDFVSQEQSKRLFWALRFLANDVAACCGLPKLLSDEDIDQGLPIEVSDTFIEKNRIDPQPRDQICYASGANEYIRLYMIRDKVSKFIYETRTKSTRKANTSTHVINLGFIREIEDDLERWVRGIPIGYRLGTYFTETKLIRAQFILALSYAYVQLYLSRPFLHYAIRRDRRRFPSGNGSPSATASIQASEVILALSEDMYRRGLLNGDLWPVTRIIFSAILTILYYLVACPESCEAEYEAEYLFGSLVTGRKLLDHLAKLSFTVNRSKNIFLILISSFPTRLRDLREKILRMDGEVFDPVRAELSPDHYTAWLASVAFSLRSQTSPGQVISTSAAAAWNREHALKHHSEQVPIKMTTASRQHEPSKDLDFHPTAMRNEPSTFSPDVHPNYAPDRSLDPAGDMQEFLEAHPFDFQQDCLGESWVNALNASGLSEDFSDWFTNLESIEDFFQHGRMSSSG
ncbi:transcriptional regulator family: Fungal Specific TF [Penicillium riverlandense]|uniref:transcriptional regulator family: Fungal Specific TF n=1 Tax=Penicillium riverlandense TaxID=1903569 RepID=UPI002547A8A4|nr:transcriptional regulator family: Fungal Specific TF [Penicillium riverlandense]KAJ5833216.1 transcriptional regulator family: Fungal Specific TF [Penicillium riverlandense]